MPEKIAGATGGGGYPDRHLIIATALAADASLVVLAERLQTIEIATLDQRHFRTVRPLSGGGAFRLLPLDR